MAKISGYLIGTLLFVVLVVGIVAVVILGEEEQLSEEDKKAGRSEVVEQARVNKTNEELYEVSLNTLDGEEVTLEEWKGDPLVVNLWASWCPFCTDELPAFARLQSEYSDVEVIAVNRGEEKQTVEDFLSRTEDISKSDLTFLQDSEDKIHPLVNGFSMPETLFIAPDGTIVFHKRGPMEFEQMKAFMDAMESVQSS